MSKVCAVWCLEDLFASPVNQCKRALIRVWLLAELKHCPPRDTTFLVEPLGLSSKTCCSLWDGVMERFERRLATWKEHYSSEGIDLL